MKLFKYTGWDALPLSLSLGQFAATVSLAAIWQESSVVGRIAGFTLLVTMTVYNIVIVSHQFTHLGWFHRPQLDRLASMLNSVNAGQSVMAYALFHVRNHHRYHNDPKEPGGTTHDLSSTFRYGMEGEHAALPRYALLGAANTLLDLVRTLLSVFRLWRVGEREVDIRFLVAKSPRKRAAELMQIRLDRAALFAAIAGFAAIDWSWLLLCYLPVLYLSFALVNVQNYFEHYGASPTNRHANSVSHYGSLYNLLTFNDGYHQEHHLNPRCHWRRLPRLRSELDSVERIISPVPALLGFLHRNRPQLARPSVQSIDSPR
ncbi:fatty acid desaturase (plasmid) [Rhizobium leguminosarum]